MEAVTVDGFAMGGISQGTYRLSEQPVIRKPRLPVYRPVRPHLAGLTQGELGAFLTRHAPGPSFRARQIFEWIHAHGATSFSAMTSIPGPLRARLAEIADCAPMELVRTRTAVDGTVKLLLSTPDGHAVETVLIPNEGRGYTQCVSSMVGCSLTCRFCATATMGFTRMLAAWEIVEQVRRARAYLAVVDTDRPRHITNVVFMGMGEPLHNYGALCTAIAILSDPAGHGIAPRRVTVSTAGVVPLIERFARDRLARRVGLAVSLNATTDEVRNRIMPVNRRWDIDTLLSAVARVPTPKRRRITLEYVLLSGVNDTSDDARRLSSMAKRLSCQVNLIPFNPHPGAPFARPSASAVESFHAALRCRGVKVHLRRPRGEDIDAACGQLAAASRGEVWDRS